MEKYYAQDWNTLYAINTYIQSTQDEKAYENKALGGKGFPYTLKQFAGKNYSAINVTPYGNSLTSEFAKAAITGEALGSGNSTDMLTISYSSPDYIGHSFGPNSIEEEDNFLRLDKELGDLLDFLDGKVGRNQYIVFLSADHGAAHVPGFMKENKLPAANFGQTLQDNLNAALKKKFGRDGLVTGILNYQIHLNRSLIDSLNLDEKDIKNTVIQQALSTPGIARTFDIKELRQSTLNAKMQEMLINGYYPERCGDVQLILNPQWIEGFENGGTTHGLWYPYDTHIPLLWYGWGIKAGKTNRETYITDIAPTLAALLHIQMPNGSIGRVIEEIRK